MESVAFEKMLMDTIIAQAKLHVFLFCIIGIALTVDILWYVRKKEENGFSIWALLPFGKNIKTKLSAKDQIAMDIFVLLILIVMSGWKIVPTYLDVSEQSYCEVQTTYIRTEDTTDAGGFLSYGHVYAMIDGKQVHLDLPANWSSEDFPEGEHTGLVSYSERSKYILKFSPN